MFSGMPKSVAITLAAFGVGVGGYGIYSSGIVSPLAQAGGLFDQAETVSDVKEQFALQVPASLQAASGQQNPLIELSVFWRLINGAPQEARVALDEMNQKWDISYAPMIVEIARFLPVRQRAEVVGLMEVRTGQSFGGDFSAWYDWIWKQKFEPHPQYGQFKATLYKRIDPRFEEYFQETKNAKIRLDEIRWGGVIRDGIPPLKNPKMLSAAEADYLGDNDVVFGIKLNGDARCYPKRILAWHEMFKDTIGGESVCGVY